jgi:hypothetical protein
MERKITETEAMKFGKQTKKLLESIKKWQLIIDH